MAYVINDYVTYSGFSWRCAIAHSDVHQPGTDAYWVAMSAKGAWVNGTIYAANDLVNDGSSDYYDTAGGLSTVSPASNGRWILTTYQGAWVGSGGFVFGNLGSEFLPFGSTPSSGSGGFVPLGVGGIPAVPSLGGTLAGAALLLGLVQQAGESAADFKARIAGVLALSPDPVVIRDAALLIDVSTFDMSTGRPDLDVMFTPIYGRNCIVQRIARRLLTRKGTLPYAPNWGIDVRDYLNGSISAYQISSDVASEIEDDDAVFSASAIVKIADDSCKIKVQGFLIDGAELAFSLSVASSYVEISE